jgi:hypothetical protein
MKKPMHSSIYEKALKEQKEKRGELLHQQHDIMEERPSGGRSSRSIREREKRGENLKELHHEINKLDKMINENEKVLDKFKK